MSVSQSVAPWATVPPGGDSAFDRLWRGFGTARVAIATVLLALLLGMVVLGGTASVSRWVLGLCIAYLLATLAVRILLQPPPRGQAFDAYWVSSIGVDLLAVSALQVLQAGNLNYSPLFAVPVLMAAVLGSALLAFGTAAAVTLLLLSEAWLVALQSGTETPARFVQAGLTGTGYFALAFLAHQLAVRLAREERAARRSQSVARVQAQVNELVIETLTDGVLVVDPDGEVHTVNPAAQDLLGCGGAALARPLLLSAQAAWVPLVHMARMTFETRTPQVGDVVIEEPGTGARRLFARSRLTAAQESSGESLCVIFLQDLRELEARLRTEKLAAMGRMSTAVAHEIRNPLAAISQANDLLEEELQHPAHRQLSALVRQNAGRLTRIVEEILDVARVQHLPGSAAAAPFPLDDAVRTTCEDWAAQNAAAASLQVRSGTGRTAVHFEPDHLRRILVNLLDNGARYASGTPGAIQVCTVPVGGGAELSVWSDGAPLEPTVQRHLFEPFFSSESRSSGLGLYICRELCQRHGAQIAYRRRVAPDGSGRDGNEFRVTFAAGRALADGASPATIGA